MTSVAEHIIKIKSDCLFISRKRSVSKYHPIEQLKEAYTAGQRLFGESHAQELVVKAPQMPDDVQWHFIGHLQRNKVRAIMPIVSLIHSVDSIRLLDTIEKEAKRIGKVADVLLQLHVAKEEAKSGFTIDNVRFRGLMAMATFTDDESIIKAEFASVGETFRTLRNENTFPTDTFTEISMGMSYDWHLAVAEGATLVRIGTEIFGKRQY